MTFIKTLPTEADIKRMVDEIITPELADAECRRLVELLMVVSSPDSEEQHHLAMTAARHAYAKTSSFETGFREFAGFPNPNRRQPKLSVEVAGRVIGRVERSKSKDDTVEIDGEQ